MKHMFPLAALLLLTSTLLLSGVPSKFDTQWIPSKPEVLTYRSQGDQGNGLYQISISRNDSIVQLYMNIISPGFTKTVSSSMTSEMYPLQSVSKIIVNDQITMDTRCTYEKDRLTVSTLMMPYNRTISNSPTFSGSVLDFSQIPLLVRTLPLTNSSEYSFTALNPQTNNLMPLTAKVLGEVLVLKVECVRVEVNDFEGQSIYTVEKGARHRVMRVEQPAVHRVTELIQ